MHTSAFCAKKLPFREQWARDFANSGAVVMYDALPQQTIADWRALSLELVIRFGIDIERRSADHLLTYRVVTGEVLRQHAPQILAFYSAPETADWVRQITGAESIVTSARERSAININCLERPGERYRWHFDAIPYTLLLYLTDHSAEDGGALEFWRCPPARVDDAEGSPAREPHPLEVGREKISITPRAGMMVLMDGTRCYHSVAPVLRPISRLSIPMVFPVSREHERPEGLDDYLYQPALAQS